MSVERRIAWKFMLMGTEQGRFSPMTLFAWLAIGVGVGAMASLLSVMYGFESALRDRVLKAYPHVMVSPRADSGSIPDDPEWTKKLRALEGVKNVVPYLEAEMIVQSEYRTLGGVVWGTEEQDFLRLKPDIVRGKPPNPKSNIPQVLVGSELADRLSVNVGSRLKLVSPLQRQGAFGAVPRYDSFEVSGIYQSGHYDFDQQYLFGLLPDVQDLLRQEGKLSGWHVWGESLDHSGKIQEEIAAILPPEWEAQEWSVFNAALFSSLKLEQYAMFTILSFAILIAVLNIVITLMMHVTHKRRNIGVLRALGASANQIQKIFLWQGALLGGVGLALGAVLTAVILTYIKYFSAYQLPEIYYDRTIPIEIRPLHLTLIFAVAVVMILIATFFPSRQAARLNPIEAIRE